MHHRNPTPPGEWSPPPLDASEPRSHRPPFIVPPGNRVQGDPLIATVSYLQWHRSDPDRNDRATDLFHRFHHDPPTALTEAVFDDLYQEVAKVETNDLEQLFAEWNRGSGRESDQFLDLRYCDRCHSYIEGRDEAVTHTVRNHGYDAFHDASEPAYLREIRSMSVGDIVTHGDTSYACAPIRWREIRLIDGDTP